MKLKGKRVVILAEVEYEDLELWYPYYRLLEEGAQVTIVGPEAKVYESKHGYPATAKTAAEDVSVDDVDGVVIPGGFAPIAFAVTRRTGSRPWCVPEGRGDRLDLPCRLGAGVRRDSQGQARHLRQRHQG